MKTLFLLCAFIYASISFSFGQTSKGSKFWMLSGNIQGRNTEKSLSTNANSSITNVFDKNKSFSLAFSGGKFLKNNLAHGISLRYEYENVLRTSTPLLSSNENYNSYKKTIELNYYVSQFISVTPQLYFYGEPNIGVSHSFGNSTYFTSGNNVDNHIKSNAITMNLNIGIRFISKKMFFIDAKSSIGKIKYESKKFDDEQISSFEIYNNPFFSFLNLGIGKNF